MHNTSYKFYLKMKTGETRFLDCGDSQCMKKLKLSQDYKNVSHGLIVENENESEEEKKMIHTLSKLRSTISSLIN